MWENVFKVAYMPKFTPAFCRFIKEFCQPSCKEEPTNVSKTAQYDVGEIQEIIEEQDEKHNDSDIMILIELQKQGIAYVEF